MLDNLSRGKRRQGIALIPSLVLFAIIVTLLISFSPILSLSAIDDSILISEWILIFLPSTMFLWLFRIRPTRDLKFVPISARTVLGVILASISGILLTGELVVFQNKIVPIPPEYLELLRDLFSIAGKMSVHQAVFVFAVSPAICEEILFRGIILQGALRNFSRTSAILISGFLFGLFHLDPYRFLGTMVLGFIMGYIATEARSLLASVTYHLTNNLVILLVMNQAYLRDIPWLTEEDHLPIGVFVLSAAVFWSGLRLIKSQRERETVYPGDEPGNFRNILGNDP
jgi:membrane protease YdiL (CAAX protease family)